MLKESEDSLKRCKLALSLDTAPDSDLVRPDPAGTPPGAPSTPPPLNMTMGAGAQSSSLSLATHHVADQRGNPTVNRESHTASNTTSIRSMAPTSTANAMLDNSVTTAATTPPDHYSLRWNNHQNHLMRAFDALLQSKTLVDVTLVCAETSIRAHKMVLSACSPFFQRVFAETPCKHPVIVLKDFRGWVVQAIIDFMYRGEISVPQERLQTLIQAGESLQVRGLVESSIPEHNPTPAASPDDFGLIDTSLLSSELERFSSFDEESPSMVASASKIILPSRIFCASYRREKERKRERDVEHDMESDQELLSESTAHNELCTSPMPRRKQARPRRRSGELTHELAGKTASTLEAMDADDLYANQPAQMCSDQAKAAKGATHNEERLSTVIKSELIDNEEEDGYHAGERDSGNDSHDHPEELNEKLAKDCSSFDKPNTQSEKEPHLHGGDLEYDEQEEEEEAEDIEELIHNTNELHSRRKSALSINSEGPEDLCTTKKDNDESGNHSASDNEDTSNNNNNNKNNNNNSTKLNNNNNRVVLSLKDIRQLNQPASSSTPNSSSNSMTPFPPTSLRDLHLDRASMENQCKMEALEAQMQAAAACAAAAVASGENPFQHMEHQMDLSLAAAAAAAAVSHQQSRERDEALQREHREMQHHNAYANSILGQMGMPGMPSFGPGPSGPPGGPGVPSAHERLEESMNRLGKEFPPSSPMSLPPHYNPQDGPPHPPSPLPFPVFGLDSPLGLFPPGIDPGKLYNPLMEMSDPRGLPGDTPPFLKKKMPRPKGQHSAPRGGPPRSWTNAELTEALQHVWNKKMTTSQASRIFGIPYNSLLMYVRGKYGKSLKLEQLRKDCISGPPLELLQMGVNSSSSNSSKNTGDSKEQKDNRKESQKNNAGVGPSDLDLMCGPMQHGPGSDPDLMGGPNSLFNPFNPQGFYPDFHGGFPGLPLSMLNLLPPSERQHAAAAAAAMHHSMGLEEDCKSDRSKQSSMDDEYSLGREDRHRHSEIAHVSNSSATPVSQLNGAAQD